MRDWLLLLLSSNESICQQIKINIGYWILQHTVQPVLQDEAALLFGHLVENQGFDG